MRLKRFFEPCERLILFTEPGIDQRDFVSPDTCQRMLDDQLKEFLSTLAPRKRATRDTSSK